MINKKRKKDKNQRFFSDAFFSKSRKGDITSQQIVLITIVIASAIVIFLFVNRLDLGGASQREICHASVVARASAALLKQTVPLNCKTDYICLSKDGSCEKMTSPEIKKVKTKQEVYNILAEEGANCWWMFGEGKADYIGGGFESDLYCSLCSQIGFDDSLYSMFATDFGIQDLPMKDWPSLINKGEFYTYLANTKISGKDRTYMDYFLGLNNSKLISDALQQNSYNFGYIDVKKQHFVMMGEFKEVGPFYQTVKDMGKGALTAFALPIPVIGGPIAIALLISPYYNPFGQKTKYMLGTIVEGGSGHIYLAPAIIEANSEDYNNLKCEDIKTLA